MFGGTLEKFLGDSGVGRDLPSNGLTIISNDANKLDYFVLLELRVLGVTRAHDLLLGLSKPGVGMSLLIQLHFELVLGLFYLLVSETDP